MRRIVLWITLCLLPLAAPSSVPGAVAERYSAVFRDGSIASSPTPPDWHDGSDNARLAKRRLFRDGPTALVLRDRFARPELRPPYLVLSNGDVLPGRVVGYEPRDMRFGNRATLSVAPEPPLAPLRDDHLAIRADRVERIVTSAQTLSPPGPQLVLADGAQIAPRSVRWNAYGVSLLTDRGVASANFAEVREALFPVDQAQAVLEDSLYAGQQRIVRLSTREGAALTGSRLYRYTERDRRRRDPELRTQVVLQPSWALEPITVLEASVCMSSFREAHELPLSLLAAEDVVERGMVGASLAWQRNRSVHGAPLASGELQADLGLGVHAHSEMAFPLPPDAKQLSLWVGIDQASGPGGCVICQVRRDSASGKVLWDSGYLRGSDGLRRVGPLDVSQARRVVLVTLPAHQGRPAGADPLDIRDDVAWLMPLVTIDGQRVLSRSMAAGLLAGADDWRVDAEALAHCRLQRPWSAFTETWDTQLEVQAKHPLTFTRQVTITPASDVLEFVTAAPPRKDEQQYEVLVDGELLSGSISRDPDRAAKEVAKFAFSGPGPEKRRDELRSDALHYWWDLRPYRGREVTLTFRLRSEKTTGVVWRSLGLRGAVTNLPASGELPTPAVLLTSLEPLEAVSLKDNARPRPDALPARGAPPIQFVGQTFSGGYGMTRHSRVSFAVKPEYRKFVALVGACREEAGPFRVLLNDRVVWEGTSRAAAAGAEWIEVPIPAGTEKISLETGPDGGYQCFAAFSNAGFLTSSD